MSTETLLWIVLGGTLAVLALAVVLSEEAQEPYDPWAQDDEETKSRKPRRR